MEKKFYSVIIRFKVGTSIKVIRYYSNADKEMAFNQMQKIKQNPRCISACMIEERRKI